MTDPRDKLPLHKLPKEFSPYNLKRFAQAAFHPGPMRDCLIQYAEQWEHERQSASQPQGAEK
jgi:hypothetical protein